jgi:hypothetical protein
MARPVTYPNLADRVLGDALVVSHLGERVCHVCTLFSSAAYLFLKRTKESVSRKLTLQSGSRRNATSAFGCSLDCGDDAMHRDGVLEARR